MVVSLEDYRKSRRVSEAIPFGEWVAIARKNQGWTQDQLGERVGYSQSVISRMETGALEVDAAVAASIATVLNNPGLLRRYCDQCPVCQALDKLTRQPKPAA